jgi:hypothetical protein
MRSSICLLILLAVCAGRASADEPRLLFDGCRWSFPKLHQEWQQRKCWCPDDYCIKALPTVPPNAHGCVDDYCIKALPKVTPNARGCVDDYCPKTCPLYLGSLCEPWYTCGPGRGCPSKR